MNKIFLTINEKQYEGEEGNTVLEVCQANGIYLPTLCHMDGLSDTGGCRMCIVEIEKERKPVPACTYPARNKLVIRTHTEKLEKYRKQVLELFFTERNHFCPFCEASGQCELQTLAYRYQIDHIRYPYIFPSVSIDTSNKYWVLDQNRCILCGRCVRACNEISANHSLEFSRRGFNERIVVDLNQPLAGSTCKNYGACVQACPTGAIFDKFSLYKGRESECAKIDTICPSCGVACEIRVLVKDNQLVKIKAPVIKDNPRASLCRMGRFELVTAKPPRILSPMIKRDDGSQVECSLDDVLELVAGKFTDNQKATFSGIVSCRIPGQTLSLFKKFMNEIVGSDSVDTVDGPGFRIISEGISRFQKTSGPQRLNTECSLEIISDANCIILIGANPDLTHPVVSALIRKAVDQRKTKLIVIDAVDGDMLSLWSTLSLKINPGTEQALLYGLAKMLLAKNPVSTDKVSDEFKSSLAQYEISVVSEATGIDNKTLESVCDIYANNKPGIIIYGDNLLQLNNPDLVTALMYLANITGNLSQGRLKVLSLKPRANSRGAWEMNLAKGTDDIYRNLYLLLGDEMEVGHLIPRLKQSDFSIVQASYFSPITQIANVVLPSPIWAEREGHFVSQDGRVLRVNKVLCPPEGCPPDEVIFTAIQRKIQTYNLRLKV